LVLAAPRRRDEARELLAPVYGWFTQDFDKRGAHIAALKGQDSNAPAIDSVQRSRSWWWCWWPRWSWWRRLRSGFRGLTEVVC
jgi:hypothetical protein